MQVNREELLGRLQLVSAGLSKSELLEQSSCVVFRGKRLMTYNGEVAASHKNPLPELQGAVQAAPLIAILSKMPEETLEVTVEDGELRLQGKRRKAGVVMEANILLPIDTVEPPVDWQELPADFGEAVQLVEVVAGRDETAFEMTCIHLHPQWIEAGDDFQLTRYKLETGFSQAALVRRDALRHIVGLGMSRFSETPTWLHFKNSEGLVLSCRRFTQEYPDLTELYKVKGTKLALPKALKQASELAEVFSSEVQDANLVLVELKPGWVRVTGRGASGWYTEPKKVVYDGPRLQFMISPKTLATLVTDHNECIVSEKCLAVQSGRYCYVTSLSQPDDKTPAEEAGAD